MQIIALTGALATGKSTVSNLLRAPPYNFPIIDADVLARQVVEPGTTGYKQVVAHFGPSTPDLFLDSDGDAEDAGKAAAEEGEDDNGRRQSSSKSNTTNSNKEKGRPLNRAALGRRVFGADRDRQRDRKILNGIIHPLVRRAMFLSLLYYYITGHGAVVCDIPLLYESGLDIFASVVIMVAVRDPVVQMRRLRERDRGLSEREAEERVGSQMGVGEKVERTVGRGRGRGKVVWNDGGREELEGEVKRVVGEIEAEGWGEWGRWWLWGSPVAVLVMASWVVWCGLRTRRGWARERRGGKKAA